MFILKMLSNFPVIMCQILGLHACKMLYRAIVHLIFLFVYRKEEGEGNYSNAANDIPFFVNWMCCALLYIHLH